MRNLPVRGKRLFGVLKTSLANFPGLSRMWMFACATRTSLQLLLGHTAGQEHSILFHALFRPHGCSVYYIVLHLCEGVCVNVPF